MPWKVRDIPNIQPVVQYVLQIYLTLNPTNSHHNQSAGAVEYTDCFSAEE